MKYIAENTEDMLKIAQMLVHGEITAEEYCKATDSWVKGRVEEELKRKSAQRKVIKVTARQVAAAKFKVECDRLLGKETSEDIIKIANARKV